MNVDKTGEDNQMEEEIIDELSNKYGKFKEKTETDKIIIELLVELKDKSD